MHVTDALRAAIVAGALVVAGCAGSDTNDADVAFAQDMIPHHQQAVEMARLADERAGSDAVRDLAADIEAAQDPEIETMTGWLEEWDAEVPDSSMEGMDHSDMSGMMSTADMSGLEGSSGPEFDQMWLTMMIEHHEGAIQMAQTEQADGANDDAVELAEKIEQTQAAEVDQLEQLLD